MPEDVTKLATLYNIEVVTCGFDCKEEQLRAPRKVRVGLFQHQHPVPPATPIKETRDATFKLAKKAIEVAYKGGVNVFCFQEAWSKFIIKIISKQLLAVSNTFFN